MSVGKVEKNILDKFQRTSKDDWDVYLPCGYTYVEKELERNADSFKKRRNGWVMGITGADNFAAKDRLWSIMSKQHGRDIASLYMPEGWLTYDPIQMKAFQQHAKDNAGQMYIMKKNIQRQEGLKIFSNPNEAINASNEGYVIIQKIVGDPYIIGDRKINLRVYILIKCYNGKKELYVFDDGFIYYSKAAYTTGRSPDEIITTGYIDRSVYKENPLTTQDFLKYIDSKHGQGSSSRFTLLRNKALSKLMDAFAGEFCHANDNVVYSQTFGMDIQPNHDLSEIKMIEINKAPSIEIMEKRDGDLKQKMTDDSWRVLGITPNSGESNGFKKVWGSSI
ncbi:tubulin-tyrosine ligase family-domain-containing protein [Blyttiomyces helicus]|uniref:Tubulin-tyrosine ligase family-domain-containing protein n=1 Tax=Blyttiomyces helicus TaxID=388810 RepID=A0A4P9WQQ1_9FUNG|nr:tubulin-tyrosine ligase family-domain-containing protein [Blyttiomyces helicus]|eukprot:RKO94513.1 tubulin-tyrosine ligase family-domain-containing protein [Blyttiomyces helicus]